MERKSMSQEALERIASRFRVLSESNRLRLLIELEGGERNVGELVEATGLSQANASRHLRALVEDGILGKRKQGLNVYYFIADASIFEMCESVCGSLQRKLEGEARVFSREG